MARKKEGHRINWTNVSFKRHMEMNTHWELLGFVESDVERERFLISCTKQPIEVWFEDLKTGQKRLVDNGTQAHAKNMALAIVIKESNGNAR